MEKIPPTSTWNLPATAKQRVAITRLCIQLGYKEPYEDRPMTRWEARTMIAGFRQERFNRRISKDEQPSSSR